MLALVVALAAGCAAPASGPPVVTTGEAAVLPEAYAHSVAALGFPGARRAFQVGHGSVISNGEIALTWRWAAPAGDTATSPVYFERDGVPVAHWSTVDGAHRVAFEAAAAPVADLGDTTLLLSVRMTVTRLAAGRGAFTMEVAAATTFPAPHPLPWEVPDAGGARLTARAGVVRVDGRPALGFPESARPAAAGTPVARIAATLAAELDSGASHRWDFWMPLHPALQAESRLAGVGRHDRIVGEARSRWREWLARGAVFETPDTLVQLAWRAALVTLIQGQERDQGRWVPIGNPFQYRDVWIRDAARVVRALAVAGHTEMAREDARTLARFQFPSGALLSQRGQLDGTGQALWAFEQASALPPSAEAARALLPFAAGGVDWIERSRTNTRELKLPWAGLLPFADPRDNEVVRAELVGNDAWALAGLRATQALAARAGDTTLAARAAAAHREYLATFRAALAGTGRADVPPSWRGEGRDWGNLALVYPTGVMDAGDPRAVRLEERYAAERARTGLVASGHPDSLHSYLGADLAQAALLAGRPSIARRWVEGILRHSSSTLGQSEVFDRRGGFGLNLPPHGTAAATLVDLLRNMVVCDFRDTLDLALGGDSAWWGGTRIARAPTRFGVLDVSLARPGPTTLEARFTPVRVPVRVRVPDGMQVSAVLSRGARSAGRYVEADGGAGVVSFRVRPAGDAPSLEPGATGGEVR